MYQSFNVVSVRDDYINNKIIIATNFDIDQKSLNDRTVQLYSKSASSNVNIDYIADNNNIIININDDIVLDSEYIIKVSEIKTVTGELLRSGIRRTIVFSSGIKEKVVVLNPINNEEITNLKVALKAIINDKEIFDLEDKFYYVQIADDVAFINIVLDTKSKKSDFNLKNLPVGQYYIRARVEKNDDYGQWSRVETFISLNKEAENNNDNEPIFIDKFELIDYPVNGTTPESIILKFSKNIDQDCVDTIKVLRSDV